jgi:uroporphyrinogen-III decarboxylase
MTEMTSRQRIFTAIDGEAPDRVPIVPPLGWYRSVVLDVSVDVLKGFLSGTLTGQMPSWVKSIEAFTKLGLDVIVGGEVEVATTATRVSHKITSVPKGIAIHTTYDTPNGPLTEVTMSQHGKVGVKTEKYLITDPEADLEKIEYVLGDPTRIDFKEYENTRFHVGDQGIVEASCNSPICFWLGHRGIKDGLLDFIRCRDVVDEYMKIYGQYLVDFARTVGDYQVDLFRLRGTYDGYTIVSPEDWKRYVQAPMTKALHDAGVRTYYFLEGKCARLLDLVKATGLDCLAPLEPPPQGDCDLAEVKRRIGDEVCLKGNLSPFEFELASPGEVERMVLDQLRDGAPNGGYMLATTDYITNLTPIENVLTLIRTAKKYGRYPIRVP